MEASLDDALGRAADILSSASDVAMACHVNPDPDAIGSMLGLAGFLTARGTSVACSWGNEPFEVPRWLTTLDLPDLHVPELLVEPGRFPVDPAVLVALDTASKDRLGALAATADRAGVVVVLDHHRTNPGFGSVSCVDPEASSTAEVAMRLIERIGGTLPDSAAACLYAGLLTDTGRFQYEAATAQTLRVAASLRDHPFDHVALGRVLFEDSALAYLRVLGVALERATLVPEAGLVWTYVTPADLERAGATMSDIDDLIDVVRLAREADVACVVKQQSDGRFRVSLRSKGGTDVGAIAQARGGGGHRLAAGYTSDVGLSESVEALVAALEASRIRRDD